MGAGLGCRSSPYQRSLGRAVAGIVLSVAKEVFEAESLPPAQASAARNSCQELCAVGMPLQRSSQADGLPPAAAGLCPWNWMFLSCLGSQKHCKEQLKSFCACCQQSLLRRSFSGSSSFGLPFFLLFNDIPRKGEHGGNVLVKESL